MESLTAQVTLLMTLQVENIQKNSSLEEKFQDITNKYKDLDDKFQEMVNENRELKKNVEELTDCVIVNCTAICKERNENERIAKEIAIIKESIDILYVNDKDQTEVNTELKRNLTELTNTSVEMNKQSNSEIQEFMKENFVTLDKFGKHSTLESKKCKKSFDELKKNHEKIDEFHKKETQNSKGEFQDLKMKLEELQNEFNNLNEFPGSKNSFLRYDIHLPDDSFKCLMDENGERHIKRIELSSKAKIAASHNFCQITGRYSQIQETMQLIKASFSDLDIYNPQPSSCYLMPVSNTPWWIVKYLKYMHNDEIHFFNSTTGDKTTAQKPEELKNRYDLVTIINELKTVIF